MNAFLAFRFDPPEEWSVQSAGAGRNDHGGDGEPAAPAPGLQSALDAGAIDFDSLGLTKPVVFYIHVGAARE